MEIPIQVAIRLKPPRLEDSSQCIFSNPVTQVVVTDSGQTFHVNRALPVDCDQSYLYSSFMIPQISCFLDGCDTSVVAFGQNQSGKTYTLFGLGFECIHSESDQGIVPRFITDVFQKLSQMPEREYTIHIAWMQLVDGTIIDLLGAGLAKCNNVEETFQYLQMGWRARSNQNSHSIFTFSMEQKWIGLNGVLHHQLSTASFSKLAGYPEPGLCAIENVLGELLTVNTKQVQYEQSIITAMLKDSLGGRAFTWVIGCISTDPNDFEETLQILNICLTCRSIKNIVTVNAYADNNLQLMNEKKDTQMPESNFGLQFAASQWVKLVTNAESLFNKIVQSKKLNEEDYKEISEWLFLKAECDECIGFENNENKDAQSKLGLPRIAEDTEPSESTESDVESDEDGSQSDIVFQDKLRKYMEYFREKTDAFYSERCEDYLNSIDSDDITLSEISGSQSLPIMTSHSGRRRTVQPGESLSGEELDLLTKVAAKAVSPESQQIILDSKKNNEDPEPKLIQRELLKLIDSPVLLNKTKNNIDIEEKYLRKYHLARKISKEITVSQAKLKELLNQCVTKEKLIHDLYKNISASGENSSSHSNVQLQNNKKVDVDKQSALHNATIKQIKKHEQDIKINKKQIEQLKKQIRREEKQKTTLDIQLIKDKRKQDGLLMKDSSVSEKQNVAMNHVANRISQLDSLLKEKSCDLKKNGLSAEKELMLRREIKNLRKTRECLHDQRCNLGQKRKVYKSLSDHEERKLLECEEAIEAIDTAIEYKNALICGRSPADSLSDGNANGAQHNQSKGEQMLMTRLDKLSHDEMKTLLYKYFQKNIKIVDPAQEDQFDIMFTKNIKSETLQRVINGRFLHTVPAGLLRMVEKLRKKLKPDRNGNR